MLNKACQVKIKRGIQTSVLFYYARHYAVIIEFKNWGQLNG